LTGAEAIGLIRPGVFRQYVSYSEWRAQRADEEWDRFVANTEIAKQHWITVRSALREAAIVGTNNYYRDNTTSPLPESENVSRLPENQSYLDDNPEDR
jgi:hypothetical protein